MYAVIKSGGKQAKVEKGDKIEVELLGEPAGAEIQLTPIMIVDGTSVKATPKDLAKSKVTAQVIGETLGPKIDARIYKSKSNQSRRWGHRQHYTMIEITSIAVK